MDKRDFKLEVKTVGDEGTFEGMLSVYGEKDSQNDVMEPNAFTKSIFENRGKVPMLWQHDTKSPIGTLSLEDTPKGLKVVGDLVLEVAQAREAYALLRKGVIRGLSIGYSTVKSQMISGVRHLKEVRLYEGSLVTFQSGPSAQVSSVKSDENAELARILDEFNANLQRDLRRLGL